MKLFCDLNNKTIIITEKQQKILNEMIAYHGSKANFDEFNLAYMSSGIGAQEFGEGIYLTFDKEAAYGYGGTVYTVNIPDENKANYIYYDKPIPSDLFSRIIDNIITDITTQYPDEYTNEQSIKDLRSELYDIMDPSEGRHLMYNIHRYIDDSIVIPKILKSAGVTGFIYNNGKVNNVIMFSSRDIKILDRETVNENKNRIEEEYFTPNELLTETKTYYANMDKNLIIKDGRTAVKTTPSQLEDKLKEIWKLNKKDKYTKLKYALYQLMAYPKGKKGLEQYAKDISKIKFDGENFEIIGDIRTNNKGISYIIAESGGDWEIPLLVFIYFDGKHIRGYIPTYGNCFDRDKKTAFGNGDDLDYEFIRNEFKDEKVSPYDIKNHLKFNIDACIKDFNKHIKVTKGKLKENRNIITECTFRDLLIEAATIQDIYSKYYSDIPEDEFQQIIQSDPTWREDKPDKMGKYGKWLLNLYKQGKLKNEDLYKATDYLSYFVKYYNKIAEKDINKLPDLPSLYNVIKPYKDASENGEEIATSKSDEVRKIKEDAEKVFEDNQWLVVVPHTQEASCYYGKNTQWCTAATDSYNMFNQYNNQGPLFINIRKTDGKKFQFHFETNSFMDETDTPIRTPIDKTMGLNTDLLQYYISRYGGKATILLTCNNLDLDNLVIEGEDPYYVYNDYDGYYYIVEVKGTQITCRKGLEYDSFTAGNYIRYLGNGNFRLHNYQEEEYYDYDDEEYYGTGNYVPSSEWSIYNAKSGKTTTFPESVGHIYKFNNQYIEVTIDNDKNTLIDSNTLKPVFETTDLVETANHYIQVCGWVDDRRKLTRYDDNLVITTGFSGYKENGVIHRQLYNIKQQSYIIPPFKPYTIVSKIGNDGYEYLTFKHTQSTNGSIDYCTILPDGSLTQVYQTESIHNNSDLINESY